ncbi:MAG: glycosyltransferase [Elainellaceae cyanobacterium]
MPLQPKLRQSLRSPVWIHALLLAGWLAIALAVRLHHLTLKPLWVDEVSTLVFSLGNSYRDIPLNQPMVAEALLQPLRPNLQATLLDAVSHLLQESNHPPLYFALTHGWLHLFPAPQGYVSLAGARSLSVLWGVLTVPAVMALGWAMFRSRTTAHLAAALMAVSPFGVYLAQEARHYTLAVLWIVASLAGLSTAVYYLRHCRPLPRWMVAAWVGVNGLGLATHYFMALTLMAEAFTLLILRIWRRKWGWTANRWRLGGAIAGTAITGLVWLPVWQSASQENDLTRWIYESDLGGWGWIDPLLQTLASIVSMVYLLPVQRVEDTIAIASGLILLGLTLWTLRIVWRGYRTQINDPTSADGMTILALFCLSAIAILLLLTYVKGIGLAQVFRYHMIYFPAVVILVAAGIVGRWAFSPSPPPVRVPRPLSMPGLARFRLSRDRVILLIILLGLAGSLTVTNDFAYRKLHRPDRVVSEMAERLEAPVLVAISHQSHGQTGRLMALAWEMRSPRYTSLLESSQFYLDHQDCDLLGEQNCSTPSAALRQTLDQTPRPVDLWLLNYEGEANLTPQECRYVTTKRTDGYKYQQYQCR